MTVSNHDYKNADKIVLSFLQTFHNYFHFTILATYKLPSSDKNSSLSNLHSPSGLFIQYNENIRLY